MGLEPTSGDKFHSQKDRLGWEALTRPVGGHRVSGQEVQGSDFLELAIERVGNRSSWALPPGPGDFLPRERRAGALIKTDPTRWALLFGSKDRTSGLLLESVDRICVNVFCM